ncbi:unnamed protein product [Peronospora destructor]|uniref:protein-tyrosine-phosphatase n=1 Tax=Peronospora destructor TaxID=86335 RepID=A0AAV0TCW3_9STRA|nr:unnamed protein product [Peronospora destructor]
MTDDASSTVRVCLTRCPLPPAEERVHSLPCRIHFDGLAAVNNFFLPQRSDSNSNSTNHGGSNAEEQDIQVHKDSKDNDNLLHAGFRGIQLQGKKLQLAPISFTGLVLEDSGMRHSDDDGRIWEVEDHFNELTWWDVSNNTTSETQQLPLVLQQWHELSSARVIRWLKLSTAWIVTLALSAWHSKLEKRSDAQILKFATRHKTLQLMMSALSACLQDAAAKLVLLPVVGMSLCDAVATVLDQTLRWRARMWTTLLTLLPTLLSFKRLETAVVSAENCLRSSQVGKGRSEFLDSRNKRDAHTEEDDGEDESYDSRPLKRQKAEAGGSEQTDSIALEARQDDDQEDKKQAKDEEDDEDDNEETTGEKLMTERSMKPQVRRRVFIWDLDETLVLFASLYTGTFAQTHGKEVALGIALGEQMMTLLLAMLERHFYFSDLHDIDVDHIAHVALTTTKNETPCLNDVPERQLSVQERYERIREIYERRGHVDFLHDANSEWFAIRDALIAAIDNFSTGWLNEARQVLELICESAAGSAQPKSDPDTATNYDRNEEKEVENVNVLVTNTQLVPALCKCLIYQLDAFFPIDRVYSSAKVHKYRCFETILKKYDRPDVEFVAIGDGLEEEHVSLALGLEFHKIRSLVDLKRLRYDLQLVQVNSSGAPSSATAVDTPADVTAQMHVASSPVGQITAV